VMLRDASLSAQKTGTLKKNWDFWGGGVGGSIIGGFPLWGRYVMEPDPRNKRVMSVLAEFNTYEFSIILIWSKRRRHV